MAELYDGVAFFYAVEMHSEPLMDGLILARKVQMQHAAIQAAQHAWKLEAPQEKSATCVPGLPSGSCIESELEEDPGAADLGASETARRLPTFCSSLFSRKYLWTFFRSLHIKE